MSITIIILLITAATAVGFGVYRVEQRHEQVADGQAARQLLVTRLRDGGSQAIWDVAWMLRDHLLERIRPLAEEQRIAGLARARCQRQALKGRKKLWHDGEWSAGFVVLVVFFTVAWLMLFFLQRAMDIQILEDLGQPAWTAGVLGTVIALTVSVVGIIVTGLLGLHQLFPRHINLRRSLRIGLALNALVAVLILTGVTANLAVYRSISVLGTQVTSLEKSLAQEENTTPKQPVEIAATETDLAAAKVRLQKGMTLDRTLAVVVPMLELLLSAAPLYAGDLAVIGYNGLAARRAGQRQQALGARILRQEQGFRTNLSDLLFEAGVNPAEAQRVLGVMQQGLPELEDNPSDGRTEPSPPGPAGEPSVRPTSSAPAAEPPTPNMPNPVAAAVPAPPDDDFGNGWILA